MKVIYKKFIILGSVLLTILVNILANALPINGVNTGQVSDSFPVYFVPAGYAFSIWGLIYLALLVYAIVPLLSEKLNSELIKKTFNWFVLSSSANILWIFAWHYKLIEVTVILMLVILVSLIKIYKISVLETQMKSLRDKMVLQFPFSLYLGWISVATIANITIFLYSVNWDGLGISGQTWSAILISIASILGLIFLLKSKDVIYAGVIVWAIVAVGVKFQEEGIILGSAINTSIMLMSFIIITVIQKIVPKLKH
ncbi:tryptophan-rich sensory protein [Candidatus Dojkabacteria bacterium]|nr:tryptophan-rich sensory protein [Candidatus Dojkabacteria bacterium]